MVVQKVSVNTPVATGFGASTAAQNPQTAPAKPQKDRSKVIAWSVAGLAVVGLAGVLIYNARKGAGGAASDPLTGVGTYVRKFLDESIFAKSAEAAKDSASGVMFKMSADGNDYQLCNNIDGFGCHLVKKVPDGKTDVPNFEFSSSPLGIKMFNKDTDSARFDFTLGEAEDFKLSIDVDSWRGKVKGSSATDGVNSYNFTTEQCQDIMENLDMNKLVNDKEYRVNYISSLFQMVGGVVRKTKFQKIADKSGKTFDEIATISESKEFNNVLGVRGVLAQIHQRYALVDTPFESAAFKNMKGKDTYEMLDDFVSGKHKLEIIDDFVDADVRFPNDKVCYDLTIPTEDGARILEHLRISKDGESIIYERFNPENAAERVKIRTYYPELTEQSSCITDIESNGVEFFMESTLSGKNYVEISHPDKTDGRLKFYFNSNQEWNEGIDYGDELQPYMGYIEKVAKILSDDSLNFGFIRDFPTKGTEILQELAK